MAKELPEEIAADLIETARRKGGKSLDLSGIGLTALPEAIVGLTALQYLSLSKNKLTALPEAIANLTALQTLHLTNNELKALPEAWRQQVQQAAKTANDNALQGLVVEIQDQYPALAAPLAELVRNFDFEQLIHLTADSR